MVQAAWAWTPRGQWGLYVGDAAGARGSGTAEGSPGTAPHRLLLSSRTHFPTPQGQVAVGCLGGSQTPLSALTLSHPGSEGTP